MPTKKVPFLDDVEDAVKTLDDAIGQTIEPLDETVLEVRPESTEWANKWDRQEKESDYAWDSFSHFRDSGLVRSHEATLKHALSNAELLESATNAKPTPNAISMMSSRFRWRERVFAYDQEQERLYQLARSEAIREMAHRHEGIVEKAIDGLMVPIEALYEAIQTDPDFVKSLSKTDAKKLIDLANRSSRTIPSLMAAERLARGMPTEIVGGVVEHQVIHSVDRNQIAEVLRTLGEAGVLNVGGTDSFVGEIVDAEVVEVYSLPPEGYDE